MDYGKTTAEAIAKEAREDNTLVDVAAFYAKTRLSARNTTIYYSGDKDDLYSNDLRRQSRQAFEAQRIAVSEEAFRIHPGDAGDDINLVGRKACSVGPQGVVFYAGRAKQLPVFSKVCGPPARDTTRTSSAVTSFHGS